MVMSPLSTTPLFRTLSTISRSEASSDPRISSESVCGLATTAPKSTRRSGTPRRRPCWGNEVVRRPRAGQRYGEAGGAEFLGLPVDGGAKASSPGGRHQKGRVQQQPRSWRRLLRRRAASHIGRISPERREQL